MKHQILIIVREEINGIVMYEIHTNDHRIADELQTIFQDYRAKCEMKTHNEKWHESARLYNLLYPILEKLAVKRDQKVIYQPTSYNVIYVME